MQNGAMAEKARLYIDGEEIPGLVSINEIVLEKGTIEVPEFNKIRIIQSGITKIPVIEATYKIERTSKTLKFFRDWYLNDEVKDVVKERTNAPGLGFAKTLMPGCELSKYQEPAFDAANPTYAQVQVRFVPWDVVPVDI